MRDVIPTDVLDGAVASVEVLVDNLAKKLHAAGKITELHQAAPFEQRLTLLEEQFPHANVLLHVRWPLPIPRHVCYGTALLLRCASLPLIPRSSLDPDPCSQKNAVLPEGVQNVWAHPALIGLAQQLLGDVDIAGHPVWNLRCKTPERLSHGQATVPWHQDNACALRAKSRTVTHGHPHEPPSVVTPS